MRLPLLISAALLATAPVEAQQPPRVEKAPALQPATVTASDLRHLRWLEGSWRGEGAEGTTQAPFFERYTFASDTTLVVHRFVDSTLAQANDSSVYTLQGGAFGNGGTGPRWQLARIDSTMAVFVPVAGARNAFVWRRGTADEWSAIIEWVRADGTAMRRSYRMTRIR